MNQSQISQVARWVNDASSVVAFTINREPTPLDELADLVLHESIGETLAAIDGAVRLLESA